MSSSSANPYAIGSSKNVVRPVTYQPYQLPGSTVKPERQFLAQGPWKGLAPLFTDPQAKAAMDQLSANGEQSSAGQMAKRILTQRQQALGVKLPSHANWGVTADGNIGLRYTDVLNDYIAPIALAGATAGLAGGIGSAAGAFGTGASAAPAASGSSLPAALSPAIASPSLISGAIPGAAAALGAAPAVGGTTVGGILGLLTGNGPIGSLISAGTGAAGQMLKSRQAGRDAANNTALEADRAASERYLTQIAADRYATERRNALANESLRGSALQNLSDVSLTPPSGVNMGTITGGLKPSILANKGEVGADLQNKATLALLKSSPADAPPTVPGPTPMQQPTGLDAGLGWADLIGAGLDTYNASRPTTGALTRVPSLLAPPRTLRSGGSLTRPVTL